MSPSTALASVSRSLRTTLLAEMAIPQLYVTLLGIAATGPEPRVNLFLHRVDEHPHLRNADQRLAPGTADRLLSPPMSLILRYFMTAHAKPHDQVGDADSQAIL